MLGAVGVGAFEVGGGGAGGYGEGWDGGEGEGESEKFAVGHEGTSTTAFWGYFATGRADASGMQADHVLPDGPAARGAPTSWGVYRSGEGSSMGPPLVGWILLRRRLQSFSSC